ncbi:MAG: hypothetical protein EOO39_41005 [Cytophagaceae bacterium]|nr:MAG: hypothetical protein EOO39_41005 [Cytophagaceae bacterium]
MVGKIGGLFVGVIWLVGLAQGSRQRISPTAPIYQQSAPAESPFNKSLRFNVYTFTVTAADTGRVRDMQVKAYRGELLLTNFRVRVEGTVTGAEVADLDSNRFPELYVYSTTSGSGSFGRVYGWQFFPERKADITPTNWRDRMPDGYMGHDSLWVERDILCRKFPVYQPGDANAEPSGGHQMMRYKLRPAGTGFSLTAE